MGRYWIAVPVMVDIDAASEEQAREQASTGLNELLADRERCQAAGLNWSVYALPSGSAVVPGGNLAEQSVRVVAE